LKVGGQRLNSGIRTIPLFHVPRSTFHLFFSLAPKDERPFQLFAAARNESRRGLDLYFDLVRDLPRGLELDLSGNADLALQYKRLRARTAFGKPPLDKHDIEPALHFFTSPRSSILRTSLRGKLRCTPSFTSTVT